MAVKGFGFIDDDELANRNILKEQNSAYWGQIGNPIQKEGSSPKKRYGADLAPEEIFDEATKVANRGRLQLSGLNNPAYKGRTVAPMSTLTQRARTLKEGFAKKPAPYTKKLERVLNRSNTGAAHPDLQSMLRDSSNKQQGFSDNTMLGALRRQFRESYNPSINRFREQGRGDIRMGENESSRNLGDISRSSGILEQSSNQQLVNALKALQTQKEARREGLTSSLEQFGSQKHGHTNLVNQVNQNQFDQEKAEPFQRLDKLRQSLGPLSGEFQSEVNPDLQQGAAGDTLKALRAYGVDTSAPYAEWGKTTQGSPQYKGKLMADLPPEIVASHRTLESVNPKFKDSLYDKRKGLLGQLMGNESVGAQSMRAVPERMRGAIESLESDAKEKLKKDLASINHKFVRANQYGSPQHIRKAEERAREISKATLAERNKMLQETMKSELSVGHKGQIANLRQLGLYGQHGQKEFSDVLGNIRNMNTLGSTKWGNEQAENEDLYKNYQNEAAWEWPHMKSAIAGEARRGALGDVFRGMNNRNISLDRLADLNTNYSELEKENLENRGQLDTKDSTINDLRKQLGLAQKAQVNKNQLESSQRRDRERDRLKQLNPANLSSITNRWDQLRNSLKTAQDYSRVPVHGSHTHRTLDKFARDWGERIHGAPVNTAHIMDVNEFNTKKNALMNEAKAAGQNPSTFFKDVNLDFYKYN